MQAIHPYDEADAASLVDALTLAQQSYVFTADLRAPEHPGMAVQGAADLRVDLVAEHQAMLAKDYPSSFEMYVDAQQIWARARDVHTSFSPPPCYEYLTLIQPVSVCAHPVADGAEVGLHVCEYQSEHLDAIFTELNVDVSDIYGLNITKINGEDAYAFAREWADKRYLLGRDPAQRFEAWLDEGANYPSWHSLFTDKLTIPDWHSPADESAVFEFEFEFDDGSTLVSPMVAYMPDMLGESLETPLTADALVDGLCPASGAVSQVSELLDASVSASVATMKATYPSASSPRTTVMREIGRKKHIKRDTASVAVAASSLTTELSLLTGLSARVRREVAQWESAQRNNAGYQLHKARIEAAVADGDQYVNLSLVDDVCVLLIGTYAPDNEDRWLSEFETAINAAKKHDCGVKDGRELVIDVRSNPGGAVVLLDLFFNTVFPQYTPHHTNMEMVQPESGIIEDVMTAFGAAQSPVREIGSFHPHPACDNRATANCPAWWKKAETATVRHMGGQDYTYSAAVTYSPLFWEKPDEFESVTEWVEDGDGADVLGADNAQWDVMFEDYAVNWGPIPEMTTWVAGAVTASCGGQTVTRAIAYHLGAVTSTGGTPEVENGGRMMAGRVPGGNVISSGDFTEQFGSLWPHAGAQVSFTTHASLAYTQDTADQLYTTQTTPMEFVEIPPHFTTPVWDQSEVRDTAEGRERLVAALRQPGQPLATCTPNERNWDETCPLDEGVAVAGRLCNAETGVYDGACGPALCEFGWELVDGTCVDNDVRIVSLPAFPAVHNFYHPPSPSTLPSWFIPVVAGLAGALVIGFVGIAGLIFRNKAKKAKGDTVADIVVL